MSTKFEEPKIYQFEDPTNLAQWAEWIIYALIILTCVMMVSQYYYHQFLQDAKKGVFTEEQMNVRATELDNFQQKISIVAIILLLMFLIIFMKWVKQANINSHALGATCMKFTPGWSIGWFFVPIFNMFKPYQVLKEIWQVSCNAKTWKMQKVSDILPAWWFLWIVSMGIGKISRRLDSKAKSIEQLIDINILDQVHAVLDISTYLMLIVIIGKICQNQLAQFEQKIEMEKQENLTSLEND